MNRKLLLSAAALACATAFAYAPTFAQVTDEQQPGANGAATDDDVANSNESATDDSSDKTVFVVRDPNTGEIYLLVPDQGLSLEDQTDDSESANSMSEPTVVRDPTFRGVTAWA